MAEATAARRGRQVQSYLITYVAQIRGSRIAIYRQNTGARREILIHASLPSTLRGCDDWLAGRGWERAHADWTTTDSHLGLTLECELLSPPAVDGQG